jgi:hypothetical protein
MSGALEVGRKDASSDHRYRCACEGTAMLTRVVFQVITALTHGTLRGPISRERIAQGRTLNRIGATTTTGVTLVSATGMRSTVGTTRPVGALVRTLGMRTLGMRTLGMRTLGMLRTLRRGHIYLATGISIRGSRF